MFCIFHFGWELMKLQFSKMVIKRLARGWRWSHIQDLVYFKVNDYCSIHEWNSHPSGRRTARKALPYKVLGSNPRDLLFYFLTFICFIVEQQVCLGLPLLGLTIFTFPHTPDYFMIRRPVFFIVYLFSDLNKKDLGLETKIALLLNHLFHF